MSKNTIYCVFAQLHTTTHKNIKTIFQNDVVFFNTSYIVNSVMRVRFDLDGAFHENRRKAVFVLYERIICEWTSPSEPTMNLSAS